MPGQGSKYYVRYTKVYFCDECGVKFVTNKPAKFCSNACRQNDYRKRQQAIKKANEQQLPLL